MSRQSDVQEQSALRRVRSDSPVLVDVQNLSIHYVNAGKVAKAVHNVSFQLHEASCLGWWAKVAVARRHS